MWNMTSDSLAAASFAPSGLAHLFRCAPRACAVGCILSPLRAGTDGFEKQVPPRSLRSRVGMTVEFSLFLTSLLLEQVPGFFVFGVLAAPGVRGEEDVGLGVGGADGEDVPGVGGDDVSGDEVDVAGRVGLSVGVEVAFEGVAAAAGGAFDLDATKMAAVVGEDVVGSAVSPGAKDAESEFDGAGHEAEFDPLAANFRVRDVDRLYFH